MYALILSNTIQSVGNLPTAAKRLDTGQWVVPHAGAWTDEQAAACGYLPVVEVARPADTATHTTDYSVELVAGIPTQVWTSREWTAEELHAQEVQAAQVEQQAALAALTPEQTDALLTLTAPPPGDPWHQPSGAHDAYAYGWVVDHNGRLWESQVTANIWEPGVSGWTQTGVEWPDWVQPTGSHDAYAPGAKVAHLGKHWISDVADNVWAPGTYGWTEVA